METAIKLQLDELVGEEVHYQNKNMIIQGYKEVNQKICIITNVRSFVFFPSEVQEKFIDQVSDTKQKTWTPTVQENQNEQIKTKSLKVELPEENTNIKQMLMDAMKKVKEDANYLAQAKSLCEITNTMVNIQKTEIEMIKLHNEL